MAMMMMKNVVCDVCGNTIVISEKLLIDASQRIYGDIFLKWLCSTCSPTNQAILSRKQLNWVDVVHLMLYHLTKTAMDCDHEIEGLRFFHWRSICDEIERHWPYLWDREYPGLSSSSSGSSNNWQTSVMAALSTYAGRRFRSGKEVKGSSWTGYWSLVDDVSPKDLEEFNQDRPLAYYLEILPNTEIPRLVPIHQGNKRAIPDEDGNEDTMKSNVDGEAKRLSREMRRLAASYVFSNLDFDRPNPPGPVTISQLPTHTAPQITASSSSIGDDKNVKSPWTVTVPANMGYCMARTSHGIDRPGRWYFEVQVHKTKGSVRLGVAQILAQTQGPVGFDEYAYGLCCHGPKAGCIVHCGKVKSYAENRFKQREFKDDNLVIGVSINIPSMDETPADAEKIKELNARYPPLQFGQYQVNQEHSQTGYVSFSMDGNDLGVAFDYIYKGKYYPAISVYREGMATLNIGPTFSYPELAIGSQTVYQLGSKGSVN